ncbi:DNA polymerase V, protein UmuD [Desulfotignum phosphitoxidans DSM 13687]|uniref:DNA polymerase V, protein UmuD n=1 Tax=Desulfotignum phosphitoxidans DSM 13687 TaxID=1286635 RepID=S0FUM5_9BACT|nr:DNA polymerase V, protein UmuD [Desulfotignum phosphitoxidans DSM 13687]
MNKIYTPDQTTEIALPFYMTSIEAGFSSPADDYIEGKLDLNEHLIKNPAATFFVRVSWESMIKAGIYPG